MKNTYYLVRYGSGFQHGNFIETVEMTEEEYKEMKNKSPWDRIGVYFDNYTSALYYTND